MEEESDMEKNRNTYTDIFVLEVGTGMIYVTFGLSESPEQRTTVQHPLPPA